MSASYNTNDATSTTGLVHSQKIYIRSGIGGAGNYRKETPTVSLTVPNTIPSPSGSFYCGIGGSGNSRSYNERASISSEDEAIREALRKENAPSSFHLGIGGHGNRTGSFERSRTSSLKGSCSSGSSERGRMSSYFKI